MSEEWLNTTRQVRPARIDTATPNVARVWNYLVGGRDNFEADRRAAVQLLAAAPVLAGAAPASRSFLRRVIEYLAADAGLTQFLDLGTGIPTAGNTHEVAQSVNPACRVVYVDNDPVVLSHARALLRSPGDGGTSYLDADARDVPAVIAGARQALDLARPVAVIMIDILNFIEDAHAVVSGLAAVLAAGSYLAVTQLDEDSRLAGAAERWNQLSPARIWLRDRATVARWLDGLDLAGPGIVEVHQWRPAAGDPQFPAGMPLLGAVARKP